MLSRHTNTSNYKNKGTVKIHTLNKDGNVLLQDNTLETVAS